MSNELRTENNHTIVHPGYGKGIVLAVEKSEEGYWVTVDFEGVGKRRMLSYVDPRKLP